MPTLARGGKQLGRGARAMISPQNLAIGAAAVGLAGRSGDLFRKVLVEPRARPRQRVLVYLQSTAPDWMTK